MLCPSSNKMLISRNLKHANRSLCRSFVLNPAFSQFVFSKAGNIDAKEAIEINHITIVFISDSFADHFLKRSYGIKHQKNIPYNIGLFVLFR